jgi:HPt (histidine-containing phosphotransfer) domain-containing protein
MSDGANRFDEQATLALIAGDRELMREIAGIYRESYRHMVQEVRDAIADSDADGLRSAAHLLKGAMANFGAEAASGLALELEQMGARGTLEGAADVADRLADEAEGLAAELAAYVDRGAGESS